MIMLKIYLYSVDNLESFFKLPEAIENHINSYNEEQKLISASNYQKLSKKISELNLDINHLYFSENGKPLIDGVNISLAHNVNYYGFAISKTQNVGLDIEDFRRFDSSKLSKAILNDNEYREYLSFQNKLTFLASKWCEKEALGKMLGTGINKDVLKMSAEYKKFSIINHDLIAVVSDIDINDIELYIDDQKSEF